MFKLSLDQSSVIVMFQIQLFELDYVKFYKKIIKSPRIKSNCYSTLNDTSLLCWLVKIWPEKFKQQNK